jgi:hypothetical protein
MARATRGTKGLAVALCAGVLFFVYDVTVNGAPARRHLELLQREAQRIAPPAAASLLGSDTAHKPRQALVSLSYTSALTYAQLRTHYDRVLAEQGWTFERELPFRDWGRDLGGREARYTKGEHVASLEYAGTGADDGWTFGLGLSWKQP